MNVELNLNIFYAIGSRVECEHWHVPPSGLQYLRDWIIGFDSADLGFGEEARWYRVVDDARESDKMHGLERYESRSRQAAVQQRWQNDPYWHERWVVASVLHYPVSSSRLLHERYVCTFVS